jgi:hypothetical protein
VVDFVGAPQRLQRRLAIIPRARADVSDEVTGDTVINLLDALAAVVFDLDRDRIWLEGSARRR